MRRLHGNIRSLLSQFGSSTVFLSVSRNEAHSFVSINDPNRFAEVQKTQPNDNYAPEILHRNWFSGIKFALARPTLGQATFSAQRHSPVGFVFTFFLFSRLIMNRPDIFEYLPQPSSLASKFFFFLSEHSGLEPNPPITKNIITWEWRSQTRKLVPTRLNVSNFHLGLFFSLSLFILFIGYYHCRYYPFAAEA